MGEERWRSAVLYHDQLQGEAFRGSLPVPLRTQGRESGHLPPTLLLGQLSTGSCFWRRFSPAKKPAAWLPNPPDRLGTATKLQGTNLMVALGGAGWGMCPAGRLQENALLSIPLHPSAISAPPTSVILSFYSGDSQHFFCYSCFYLPSCPCPGSPLQCIHFTLGSGFNCIIWVSIVVVVETIIASVYLLSIIIKIGSGTDSDFIKRAGWDVKGQSCKVRTGSYGSPSGPQWVHGSSVSLPLQVRLGYTDYCESFGLLSHSNYLWG